MAKKSHSKSDKGVDSFENQKGKNSTDNEKDENPTGEPGRVNRYLKQLVANSGFILIIVDEVGEILLYDTLYDRVLGYKHEEIQVLKIGVISIGMTATVLRKILIKRLDLKERQFHLSFDSKKVMIPGAM